MASSNIVLVTGGNNGIGYELCKALLNSGRQYHVIMGSRSIKRAEEAVESLKKEVPHAKNSMEILQVDLISDDSIYKAFEEVKAKHNRLDTLVNNGGANFDIAHLRGQVSLRSSFTSAYDVNLAGTHVLTHTFMPLLFASSDPRLIFVTGLSAITKAAKEYFPTPPQPAGWPKPPMVFETIGYRCSKVALNMLMLDWNHKLKEDKVKVWAVGPGMCLTDLGDLREMAAKMQGVQPASVGADTVKRVIEGERDADVGKFVIKDGGFGDW